MSYGWIIDKVNLEFLDEDEVGTKGPADISSTHSEALDNGEGKQFKMFDDDGEWYYTGRIVGEYDGYEPLDDFGDPNAGATQITGLF
jgi:hypothetical protein